ncbi:MAG: pseudouridine-5'-phosphate glycosidase, partial [Lachnospiraceae bacterium]|nr:pseudouridine-5'-phosphate glycosidase [Lachnospiraceae bacterium]
QTDELPAFYCRTSGLKVDSAVQNAEEAAAVIAAKRDLHLDGGVLITNPIPEEYAMDETVINTAIEKAITEMDALGIKGKDCTPYLLAKIVELTGGKSLDANIRLVFNNAKVGAQIAAELCRYHEGK